MSWSTDDADLKRNTPMMLRSFTCQAGEPHTGSTPDADHGHTMCYFVRLAANLIESLEAERDALKAELDLTEDDLLRVMQERNAWRQRALTAEADADRLAEALAGWVEGSIAFQEDHDLLAAHAAAVEARK